MDVQYCTVLYGIVQYCTVLYSTVQYCTVLYSSVLYCTVLYSTLQYCINNCTVSDIVVEKIKNSRGWNRTTWSGRVNCLFLFAPMPSRSSTNKTKETITVF